MALPKIEERTLYPSLISYLKTIGFDAIGETKVTTTHPDILFKVDSLSFVIEVKIGKPEVGLKAVAQASDYAKKLGTQNIVILIYPEKYRNQVVFDTNIVEKVALHEEIDVLLLTEYLTKNVKAKPTEVFIELKNAILSKTVDVDFTTIVKLIESYVTDLNSIVYQIKTDELASEVVNKLDLFSSIGEIKDKEMAKKQVVNLAAYLLFNQLLFYHIFKRTAKSDIPELQEIEKVKQLQEYFDEITDIDYRSIYSVNILGHIPENTTVVNTMNAVIKAIKLLRAEHITHDLAGRFFHDLIPFEVRKVLAAFYTHPVAAEILAGLTIERWDEEVIDPACGSGTLLVSSYMRKMQLYEALHGFDNIDWVHKKFIETDITGIDLMPFAAHITTLNLTTQDIEEKTNYVRIATKDSLALAPALRTKDFLEKGGIRISSYTREIQNTLVTVGGRQVVKKEGAISANGKGEGFFLKPLDVVIMNPPFTDRDKMPQYMRDSLRDNTTLVKICGNGVNLWGCFLALAHLLLKEGGTIGGVIPINIARGEFTAKIRTFLFKNYHVTYWIKPVADFAFSEGASFKDSLFIAKKTKPEDSDLTGIILFKKSIRDMTLDEGQKVVERIRNIEPIEEKQYDNEYFTLRFVKQAELCSDIDNLMLHIGGTSFQNMDIIRKFIKTVSANGKSKLSNLEMDHMKEGITSPKGMSQLVYVTRPIDESRVKRSFLLLEQDKGNMIKAKVKDANTSIEIPVDVTQPSLRTSTGVKSIDISKQHDYIVKERYADFSKVLMLSKWKGKFNWKLIQNKIAMVGESRVVIPDKIRLNSENTNVLGIYSDKPLILSNLFFTYTDLQKEKCKILALSLNSALTLAQFIVFKSETLGGYIRLSANDWALTTQIDSSKLNENNKETLLKLFDELRSVEFPSIVEQLEKGFWARVKLDKTILKILGFDNSEIDELLPQIHKTVLNELKEAMES